MKVSVCTQVLNQSEFLKRMIGSVIAQTFTDWEMIIVDDGSTEDIQGLIASYNDPRIRCIRYDTNGGIPHGLNHAFREAKGDYVQPLSADEWISPDKFEVQVAYLDAHPEIGCVWGIPGKFTSGEGKRPEWEQYAWRAHNRSREAWIRTLINMENIPIGGASLLMRRSVLEDIGGIDPDFFQLSDLEWYVRFFKKYEGRVLPYRWADADQPPGRLSDPEKPGNAERFKEDVRRLHEKHPEIAVPVRGGRITVGIPVYNMAHFISKSLDSLFAQTFQDFEVIIMDDASTDNLAEVIAPYAEKMTLNYFRFDENRGVRHAFNQMVARCETEFFVSLAADDWLEPTYLEKVQAEFSKDPWLEFVASQTDFYDKDGQPIPANTIEAQRIRKASNRSRDAWLSELYYGNHYFGVGMYRTYAIREVGGMDTEAGILCDYDLYLKLLQRENIRIVEEDLSHTRIHDGNASYGPGKIDRQWLRNKYHEIKQRYYQPRTKLIIATPFYEMRGFSPYIGSMLATYDMLWQYGIQHEWWELSGDSYVDRAKNTLFNKFLEDPEATDLIMIDSDMQWNPASIINLLSFPEQIVMGSYPQKNGWDQWTAVPVLQQNPDNPALHHPVGRALPDGSALIKAAFVSGGFIRIKRDCLVKYKEHYKDYVYYDKGADPSAPERLYTEFFCCERGDLNGQPMRWGEDRVFGRRMDAIGIDSWIYPNIDMGHFGVNGWHGNYNSFLSKGAPK